MISGRFLLRGSNSPLRIAARLYFAQVIPRFGLLRVLYFEEVISRFFFLSVFYFEEVISAFGFCAFYTLRK